MTDTTPAASGERALRLRYDSRCRDCGAPLPAGTRARWNSTSRTTRCLACPPAASSACPTPADLPVATVPLPRLPDYGTAGASAQRRFDVQERQRRVRLRANWRWIVAASVLGALGGAVLTGATHTHGPLFIVLGAVLPVLKLLPAPQHINAWRSGAAGERVVGARLDGLRRRGVLAVHDRRVPGKRTNIDHIVIAPAGVFVVDTKNVTGKVSVGRSSIRVTGRRRDEMISGVQAQVGVVQQVLASQALPPGCVRGVLCFTRAELPWFRPTPGGIRLVYPRGLAVLVRRSGPLTPGRVRELASLIAERLPPA